MIRKMIYLVLCTVFTMMAVCGCQASQASQANHEDFLADIETFMSIEEVHEILGEPAADLGSGTVIDLYIISDTHVAIIGYALHTGPNNDLPERFRCISKGVVTYDQFRESYGASPQEYVQKSS